MVFAESFLRRPDLHAARPAGERWGSVDLALDLPGGPVLVSGLSRAQGDWVSGRYCRDARTPATEELAEAVHVSVYQATRDEFLIDRIDGHWIDLDHRADQVRIAGHGYLARIEWRPRPACTLWTCFDGGKNFGGGWENFLRVVLAYALLDRGGVLLHSAGVVDRSRAYLFVGRSGAGKSTLSRLSLDAGQVILSDDLNALVPESGVWRAAKVPFTGELGSKASGVGSYPAQGIYRLVQGTGHGVASIGAGRALATLMACCPFVNTDSHRLDRLTEVLERVIAELSVATLTFALDSGFWEELRADHPEAVDAESSFRSISDSPC